MFYPHVSYFIKYLNALAQDLICECKFWISDCDCVVFFLFNVCFCKFNIHLCVVVINMFYIDDVTSYICWKMLSLIWTQYNYMHKISSLNCVWEGFWKLYSRRFNVYKFHILLLLLRDSIDRSVLAYDRWSVIALYYSSADSSTSWN